jgi:hypothetical protein
MLPQLLFMVCQLRVVRIVRRRRLALMRLERRSWCQSRSQSAGARTRPWPWAGGAESTPGRPKPTTIGKNRKTARVQSNLPLLEAPPTPAGSLGLVTANDGKAKEVEDDVLSLDSNKKQRTTPSRSADLAEAVRKPRPMQLVCYDGTVPDLGLTRQSENFVGW